jgi:hypothetical protein
MRVIVVAASSVPGITKALVTVIRNPDEILLTLTLAIPYVERTDGSVDHLADLLETSVRRIIRTLYPNLRGARMVIRV